MPKGHRVVTVERQGGYAARCTVIVGGEETLCDATFGGFGTRTEARAALVHEEAPGAAGTAAEGQTPEGIDHTSTIADAPSGHEAWPDIRSIRAGKSKLITTDAVAEALAAVVELRGGPKLIVVEEDRPKGPKVYVHPALCAAVERWYDDLLGSLAAYAPAEVLEP